MTEGWMDRQLKRVREDYDSLPAWQKTAKTTNGSQSLASPPCRPSDSGPQGDRSPRSEVLR